MVAGCFLLSPEDGPYAYFWAKDLEACDIASMGAGLPVFLYGKWRLLYRGFHNWWIPKMVGFEWKQSN